MKTLMVDGTVSNCVVDPCLFCDEKHNYSNEMGQGYHTTPKGVVFGMCISLVFTRATNIT